MSLFLRVTGIINAAVWLGATVFFALVVWPGFASPEMARILPPLHRGAAAQVIMDRYFLIQYCCGSIALAHWLAEWLYAGHRLQRWTLSWIVGLVVLQLVSGLWVEPKLKRLNWDLYGPRSTPQQREHASKTWSLWQAVVQISNLIVMAGLSAYVWEQSTPAAAPRFVAAAKLRG